MLEEYPNILWALENNIDLRNQIFCKYKDNDKFLFFLENLILNLRAANTQNIKEELKDVSSLDKLNSIISELKTALYISQDNNSVEFLPDNYLPKASPDILCTNEDLNIYLEVRRVNENPYVTELILKTLRKHLKNYPYMVNVSLKEDLSLPKMEFDGRRLQESLVNECLVQFKEEFDNKAFIEDSFEIDTQNIIFEASRIQSEKGYPGIISSGCIEVPVSYLLDYIKNQLIKKALKRETFEGKHAKCLYFLVFDCFESSIDEEDIDELLYGSITHLGSNIFNIPNEQYLTWKKQEWDARTLEVKNRPSWNKINQAKNSGWVSLLNEKYLIPHDYGYISEDGLFISNVEMRHVSGVLFITTWENYSFYPNPFCDEEINNPKIMDFMEGLQTP